jgi:hypothetical protein
MSEDFLETPSLMGFLCWGKMLDQRKVAEGNPAAPSNQQRLVFVPNNSFKWAGNQAVHAPPAAAHIQEWGFFPVESAERIPPAGIASQAFLAHPAKLIINL